MKKRIGLISLGIVLALSMGACGKKEAPPQKGEGMEALKEKLNETKNDIESDTSSESMEDDGDEYEPEKKKETSGKYYKTNEEVVMFESEATIEETLIADESGVKITAKSLYYDDYEPKITFEIENNSDEAILVRSSSTNDNGNAINGYMVDALFMSEDIEPGKKSKTSMYIDSDELMRLGIKDIAEISLFFEVDDADYQTIFTCNKTIETSIADSYDYSKESYSDAVQNEYVADYLMYDLEYYADDVAYDNEGVQIVSEAMADEDFEGNTLLLEFANNSDQKKNIAISDIEINGVAVYGYTWTYRALLPGKKSVDDISFDYIIDEEFIKELGIKEIGSIAFNVALEDPETEELGEGKRVEIVLPDKSSDADIKGEEVLNENGIKLISVGMMENPGDYDDDINMLFLVENNTDKTVYASTNYGDSSVNDYMGTIYCSDIKILPGGKGFLNAYISESDMEEFEIGSIDDIEKVELAFTVIDTEWNDIVESTVTLEY